MQFLAMTFIIYLVIPRRGNVVGVGSTTLHAPTWGSTAVFHLAVREGNEKLVISREFREVREFREYREFRGCLALNSLHSLISLTLPKFNITKHFYVSFISL